jgi:mannose-6-phosphate isomerase class I
VFDSAQGRHPVLQQVKQQKTREHRVYRSAAGKVHALGGDVVVFEIQQNSDVTFHLYDWDHVAAKTGQRRPLQVNQALACIGFAGCAGGLVSPVVEVPTTLERERLFQCGHFWLWRLADNLLLPSVPRVLLCIEGAGQVEHGGANYAFGKGDVLLGGRRVPYAGADELWASSRFSNLLSRPRQPLWSNHIRTPGCTD